MTFKLPVSRPEAALIVATMFWGGTFLVVHHAVTLSGPLFFVGLRFAAATLFTALLFRRLLHGIGRQEWVAGIVIGIGMGISYGLHAMGLQHVSASQSALILAVYVPLVPLLQWLLWRQPVSAGGWLAAVLAFGGLLLMTAPESGGRFQLGRGEWLTLLSALTIAIEILLISHFAGKVKLGAVTIIQLAVASLLAFALAPLNGESLPPFTPTLAYSALGLGLLTALIQITMNWAQKTVSPLRATLIYASEPVWATLFGRFAGDRLPPTALLGGLLIVLASIVGKWRSK